MTPAAGMIVRQVEEGVLPSVRSRAGSGAIPRVSGSFAQVENDGCVAELEVGREAALTMSCCEVGG